MTKSAQQLTPRQRAAYLLGYRRAKRRYQAELRRLEDRFGDRLSELQDEYEAGAVIDQDDEIG